jgi:hypothetical protein
MDIASDSGDRVAPDRLRRRVTAASELTCEQVAHAIHAYAFGRLARSDAAWPETICGCVLIVSRSWMKSTAIRPSSSRRRGLLSCPMIWST